MEANEKEQQAVVAYIRREDGKLLSVTRKDTGQHSAPGGKVEPGESLYDAMVREVKEETGVKVLTAYPVYEGLHSSGRRVTAFRVCEWFHEPVAREPSTIVAWVEPIEIANGFGAEYHSVALQAAGLWKPSYWIEIPSWQGINGWVFGKCTNVYTDLSHAKAVFNDYVKRRGWAAADDVKSHVRLMCGDFDKASARVLDQFPRPNQ